MNKIKGLFLTLFLVVFSVSTAFANTGTNDPPIIVQGKLIKHEELPETRSLLSPNRNMLIHTSMLYNLVDLEVLQKMA